MRKVTNTIGLSDTIVRLARSSSSRPRRSEQRLVVLGSGGQYTPEAGRAALCYGFKQIIKTFLLLRIIRNCNRTLFSAGGVGL